jgi:uncharacterized protein involved in exopolysaccharide biosynthesis
VTPPRREAIASVRRHAPRPLLLVLLVTAIAAGVSFLLPKWYVGRVTILPPDEGGQSLGMLASLIQSSALGQVGLVATSSPSDIYAEILKSKRAREALVARFDLRSRYHEPNLDKCLGVLAQRVRVSVLPSRVIEVRVEDREAETSARMANALVQQLDQINQEIRIQRAGRSREFLEAQLREAGSRLRESEQRLSEYERKHGVLATSEGAAVQGVAQLIARRMALQVRRNWMRSYSDRESPMLRTIDSELSALDEELASMPALKQEASRLALDVEIERRVYTLITAQFEESRIQEESDVPTVSVLDPARTPTLPAGPRKKIVVGVTFGAALLLAAGWVLFLARRDLVERGLLEP